MTEEQKQALIEFLKFLVAGSAGQHKQIYEIALAALTAPPVILPDDGLDDCIRDWPSQWRDNFDTGYNYASWRHQQEMVRAGISFQREDE